MDSINVYLEQSRTPLPLLTTETAWLGGRHIRIRGKSLRSLYVCILRKCELEGTPISYYKYNTAYRILFNEDAQNKVHLHGPSIFSCNVYLLSIIAFEYVRTIRIIVIV